MNEEGEKSLFNFYHMQKDLPEKLSLNFIAHWTDSTLIKKHFKNFDDQISEIGKMLAGLISYLNKTTVEGTKH